MSALTFVLSNMLDHALVQPGEPVATKLHGGLHIRMTVDANHILLLELRREHAYPSETEWKTTLKYLPFQASAIPTLKTPYTLTARMVITPGLFPTGQLPPQRTGEPRR
jgi:hypothetical protein